jgi:SAM-dependent methyltransferase
MSYFSNTGFCPVCVQNVTFTASSSWFRDHYVCESCGSIPRERALMRVIESFYPAWQGLAIHETSPGGRGASLRLAKEAAGYVPSHYFSDTPRGEFKWGFRSEDLEALTFADESIDLHISQDVMEHIFNPERAFQEIARTLRPGGAHIFTVPIVNKHKPSNRRASMDATGQLTHLQEAQYHGNPVDETGALVTFDWGYDICQKIHEASGMFTHLVQIDDLSNGIRAEYVDVLVSIKR